MFNWLRNLLKSKDDRHQERLTAYLDGVLPAAEQKLVEQELAQNPTLRAEVEAQQQIKRILQQLPRQAAPRNFLLDPAKYAAKRPSRAAQIYPTLRLASAAMALLLVGVVALDWNSQQGANEMAASQPASVAQMATTEPVEMEMEMVETESANMDTAEPPSAAPAAAMATDMADDGAMNESAEMFALELPSEEMPTGEAETGEEGMSMMATGSAEPTAEERIMTEEEVMADELAPRPLPTPTMSARMAEPTTAEAPSEAKLDPTPTAEPELAPPPPNPWRTAQLALAGLTAILLLATLLVRRRL
jgi:anti-sigma factor RsiW